MATAFFHLMGETFGLFVFQDSDSSDHDSEFDDDDISDENIDVLEY